MVLNVLAKRGWLSAGQKLNQNRQLHVEMIKMKILPVLT